MRSAIKSDKEIERNRYNIDAQKRLNLRKKDSYALGAEAVQLPLRQPYLHYEQLISLNLSEKDICCELAAGYGMHTGAILRTRSSLVATDISKVSLDALLENYQNCSNLSIRIADIEMLPFNNESFTAILCAGGLSYGDNDLVLSEIYRVLKPGGLFICIDSLNHNPIYRLNRWIHYLKGNRTKSTLIRMPTVHTIQGYKEKFSEIEVWWFGGFSFIFPVMRKILSNTTIAEFITWSDRIFKVRKMAFKFVMIVKK